MASAAEACWAWHVYHDTVDGLERYIMQGEVDVNSIITGDDDTTVTYEGGTALHMLASWPNESFYEEAAQKTELLLRHKCNPRLTCDENGKTPLDMARHGYSENINLIGHLRDALNTEKSHDHAFTMTPPMTLKKNMHHSLHNYICIISQ